MSLPHHDPPPGLPHHPPPDLPRPSTHLPPPPPYAASSILVGTDLSDLDEDDDDDDNYPDATGANTNTDTNGRKPSSSSKARDITALIAAYERTMAHSRAVLAARKAPRVITVAAAGGRGASASTSTSTGAPMGTRVGGKASVGNVDGAKQAAKLMLPPVWTPHREWLCEALDYVGRDVARGGVQGETISETSAFGGGGGSVVSLVLGGVEAGKRGYLDGEVLICEVGGGKRVWEAWERTRERKGSVVVLVGRGWGAAEEVVPWPREMWEEGRAGGRGGRREGGTVVRMVKLQKAELGEVSWWMRGKEGGESVLGLEERKYMGDEWYESKRIRCPTCGVQMPRVYKECWICMNSSCGMFWREGFQMDDGGSLVHMAIPSKLCWEKTFLMSRTLFDPDMRPSWELKPDLKQAFPPVWEVVKPQNISAAGTIRVRSLWRGGVCDNCRAIVPAIEWCVWHCKNSHCSEKWRLRFDIGLMPLRAAIPRMFTGWPGHAMVEPEWAGELGGYVRRMYRKKYMVDSWYIGNGALPITFKLITPTAEMNERDDGADDIWANLLDETRLPFGVGPPNRPESVKEAPLVLTRSNQFPKLAKYFHKTFGAEYGFGNTVEGDSPTSDAWDPKEATESISQAQAVLAEICNNELVGFDLDHPNSVQVHGYMDGMGLGWHVGGEEDVGNLQATISLGSDAELFIRRRTDVEAHPLKNEDEWPPTTCVPLLHGSIVLIYGPFHEFFQTKIDCKGPLRFAMTARHIKQAEKDELQQTMTADKLSQRRNGPWFMGDDDSEDDEEELMRNTYGSWSARPPSRGRSSRHMSYGVPTSHPYQTGMPQAQRATLKRPRPQQRSPSPEPRQKKHKGGNAPDEADTSTYKTPGWTPQQKQQIYQWHQQKQPYKEIAKMFEQKWPSGKVNPNQLRMVVHRVRQDRRKRAELLGETFSDEEGTDHDGRSSLAPSDSASATLGTAYVDPAKWTQPEIDLLVECRNLEPPMSHREIAAKLLKDLHKVRSEKACREQMTTINRKKRGVARARGPTSAPRQAAQSSSAIAEPGTPLDAASPLARRPINAGDLDNPMRGGSEDSPPSQEQAGRRRSVRRAQPPTPPPLPVRAGRVSRASRSGGGRVAPNSVGGNGETAEGTPLSPVPEEPSSTGRRIRTRSVANILEDEEAG